MSNDNDSSVRLSEITRRLRAHLIAFGEDESLGEISDDVILREVMDSMSHFYFLLSLEEIFEIEIPDEKFNSVEMGSLANIAMLVQKYSENLGEA